MGVGTGLVPIVGKHLAKTGYGKEQGGKGLPSRSRIRTIIGGEGKVLGIENGESCFMMDQNGHRRNSEDILGFLSTVFSSGRL
jgi:hypothetical protein